MRIAVSGVAGSGKTTLCKLIADNTGLSFMPDWMDIVLKEIGFENGQQLSKERGEQGVIEWYIRSMERKVDEDRRQRTFIADKSVLDHGARWYARKFPSATPEQYMLIDRLLVEGIGLYSRIIFLPLSDLNSKAEDNKLRDTDYKHRKMTDLIIRGLAAQYSAQMFSYNFRFQDSPENVMASLGLQGLISR